MKRRIRLFLWFLSAFIKRYGRLIFLGLFLGILGFFLYSRLGHRLPQRQKITRIGLVGRYTPDRLPLKVKEKLSTGLVKISPQGTASANLAESWEIKDEGKTYLVYLKDDLFWQDKTPLQADQIHFEMENIKLSAPDEKTLEFKLKEPFSPFLTLLGQPVFKEKFLGVGPYRLVSSQSTGKYLQSIRLKNKDVLVFVFYPTERAAILGFKLGEVDRLEEINEPGDLIDWPNARIIPQVQNDRFTAVFFNTEDDLLGDKTLRQALTYGIKKPQDETRALSPLSPQSWAYNNQVKPYRFNQPKAREFLETFKKEREVEKVGLELTTTLSHLSLAEEIKKSWEEVGVETKIKVVFTLPETFQAFLASQEIPADPDQYTLWHSTQTETANITGYKNPKIDKLLEDGRKIINREERKMKYLDFQRFLVEEAPAAFISHPTTYTIVRKQNLW